MSATAAKQKATSPKVVIDEDTDQDFTPKALRVYAKTVDVSVGKTGHGRASVFIQEGEYERRQVFFNLRVEGPWNGEGAHFSEVMLDGATITAAGLDNLIEALTLARAEARGLGLFTQRPIPRVKSV